MCLSNKRMCCLRVLDDEVLPGMQVRVFHDIGSVCDWMDGPNDNNVRCG